MSDKHFDAILAKNDIARELSNPEPNIGFIFSQLAVIEHFIGQANQPSVADIYENNTNPFKRVDL